MKKTAIATIVAGLGIGAAKLIYDHRHNNNKHIKSAHENGVEKANGNVSVKSCHLSHAYENLSNERQVRVTEIINDRLIPQNADDKYIGVHFQIHADELRRTLEYLSHRYAYRTKIASKDLGINEKRMKNLTIGLTEEGVLEHAQSGNNTVIQGRAKKQLHCLGKHYNRGLVKPKPFLRSLRNSVAELMY